jgi:hypothetical protein
VLFHLFVLCAAGLRDLVPLERTTGEPATAGQRMIERTLRSVAFPFAQAD